jgi:CBS domain containing-hemolysin-like protein
MGWILPLLLLYVLVVLAEQALFALSPGALNQIQADQSTNARRTLALYDQIRSALAALLLTRMLFKIILAVCICAAVIQSETVRSNFFLWSQETSIPIIWWWLASCLLIACVLGGTFWLIRRLALRGVGLLRNVPTLLYFLTPFVLFWKKLFLPFIGGMARDTLPSAAAISTLAVENPGRAGEKREMELLKSIVQFGDTTVKQVMQPRSRVIAVDFRTNYHDLLSTVRQAEFSRIPVYTDDLDNVTGILYVKDLVAHLEKPADFKWQELIRSNVLLAPESKRCSELLQEFKQEKIHLAVVVDEYGGSSGIVTMEDLLEEVTGEIRDEFDEESEVRFRKLDEFNFLFEAQTPLMDVYRVTGLPPGAFDEVRNNADTLAGLALELKGDIPPTGTEIAWKGFLMTVTAANNRRIEQLKLTLPRS